MSSRALPMMLAAAGLALSGCGASNGAKYDVAVAGSTPQKKLDAQKQVLYFPGEQLTWKIHIHGIEVGAMVIAAGNPGTMDGRKVLIVKSRGETSGAAAWFARRRMEITSWIDLATGQPFKHHRDDRIKKRALDADWSKHGDYQIIETDSNGKVTEVYKQTLPEKEAAYDMPSGLLAIRSWKGKKNERAVLHVIRNDMIWRTDMVVAGSKRVRVTAGNFDCIRIDGVTRRMKYTWGFDEKKPKRYFQMYVSDDARRLPVLITAKTDWGEVKMELMSYNEGS